MAPRQPKTTFDNADVVFTGRVRDLDSRIVRRSVLTLKYAWAKVKSAFGGPDPEDLPDPPESHIRVWLEVTEPHKGDLADHVQVFTGYNDGDCGVPFKQGESYLVYAFAYEGDLYTDICNRTAPIEWAEADYKFLTKRADEDSAEMRPDG